MKRLYVFGVLIFWLLAGCGSNRGYLPDQPMTSQIGTQDQFSEELEAEHEESLVGDLSDQRLEELYAQHPIPGLEEGLEQELKKWELQTKFDIPIQINKQVRNYIAYFCTERKEVFRRYLARSTRYLPMIKKVFAEYGLPEDLAYLAMIESGFNNRAYSPAHACGMWQFIRATGRRYGLTINNYVDERRDPEKATRAAAEYLLDLYKQFGSWYLAAASYNCGEGRVQRKIDSNAHLKSFWDLSSSGCLPSETKNYVPQMIAATIIAKNPKKYGFTNIAYQPPLKYEIVKVTEPTSLKIAAIAAGVDYEEIKALNPELRKGTTPPHYSAYLLKVPFGKKEALLRNIAVARAQVPEPRSYARGKRRTVRAARRSRPDRPTLCYRVRRGETLSRIARRYGTSTRTLLALNGMRSGKQLKYGQALLVPAKHSRSTVTKKSRASRTRKTVTAKGRKNPRLEPMVASVFPSWQSNKAKTTARSDRRSKKQAKKRKTRYTSPKATRVQNSGPKKRTVRLVRKVSRPAKSAKRDKVSSARVVRKSQVAARAKKTGGKPLLFSEARGGRRVVRR